jgi:hypothetical protein
MGHHKTGKYKSDVKSLEEHIDLAKLKSLAGKESVIRAVIVNNPRHAHIYASIRPMGLEQRLVTYEIWTDCKGFHLARNNKESCPKARETILSCLKSTTQLNKLEMDYSR